MAIFYKLRFVFGKLESLTINLFINVIYNILQATLLHCS